MKVLIFSLLVASALSAPQGQASQQSNQQSQTFTTQGFQSQNPIQLVLLPGGSSQSTYTTSSVQGQQGIPAGAQIVYLQGANTGNQGQLTYFQGAPQGQLAYIQGGAPQGQIAYFQGGAPQGQVAYIQGLQGASQGQYSFSQSSAPAPQSFNVQQSQEKYSSFQSAAPAPQKSSVSSFTSSQTYQPAAPPPQSSSSYKQSSFSQTKTQSYNQGAKPAPAPFAPAKSSYKGSPSPGSPGTPGTPGEGGVFGYVTIKQSQDDNFDGNFKYDFETDHGIIVDAVGTLKNPGTEDEIQVISGSYSYKTPDGTVITTTYTADENGFVAQGDHLPVAPEVPELPEAIAKSIAYAKSLPPSEDDQ